MTERLDQLARALADRYRLERELGAGGMATVYLAQDLRHDREVALKVLRPELAAALGVERFLQEIKVTASLQHPHILPLFDSGALPDEYGRAMARPYYVMPFVQGESLRDRLNREHQLPIEEAVRLAAEVADALAEAHRHGVIHRDIKPENILLSAGHAVVSDFGIARAVSAAGGERLTGTGVTIGTPAYMSPEQAAGDQVDGRSDVYALGCVLFEMLAGEPPYTGPTAQVVIAKRLSEPVPKLRTARDTVPDALDQVVAKALARVPADRFAGAGDLRQALLDLEAAVRGPTGATAAVGRLEVRERRRPGGRLVALGLTAVGILTTVLLARGRSGRVTSTDGLDPKRVAVGVFENQTGDTAFAPLGRMAADWLVQGLVRTGVLNVLDAAMLYTPASAGSGTPAGAIDLARRNGAGLAVAGRYYRSGDSILFAATVLDVVSGTVRQSLDAIATGVAEPLAAVEQLRQRVASVLVASADPRGRVLSASSQPPMYDAYRDFVQAQEFYWQGRFEEALPAYRRALLRDTSFLSAAAELLVATVSVNRCELADSIMRELELRADRLTRIERLRLGSSRARCARDFEQGLRLLRQADATAPGWSVARWGLAAHARRANRPKEALAALRALDPRRDLGWISDEGKVFYWREMLWAYHILGDTEAEQRTARYLEVAAPGRLATAYFTSLSRVATGPPGAAVEALEGVERLPSDPPLAAGERAGRSSPEWVATPAYVLYEIATELGAHGDSAGARDLAARAVNWLGSRPLEESGRPVTRYLLALALELLGRVDSASAQVRQLVTEQPDNVEYRGRLGVLAARRGDRALAMATDDWLARLPPVFPPNGPHLERVRIAAVLGDRDRALQLLETIPFGSHPVDVFLFHSDPAFASLRGDPRWIRFLKPRG
jgi:tetratricopeptide (TPR) repeat protein